MFTDATAALQASDAASSNAKTIAMATAALNAASATFGLTAMTATHSLASALQRQKFALPLLHLCGVINCGAAFSLQHNICGLIPAMQPQAHATSDLRLLSSSSRFYFCLRCSSSSISDIYIGGVTPASSATSATSAIRAACSLHLRTTSSSATALMQLQRCVQHRHQHSARRDRAT